MKHTILNSTSIEARSRLSLIWKINEIRPFDTL